MVYPVNNMMEQRISWSSSEPRTPAASGEAQQGQQQGGYLFQRLHWAVLLFILCLYRRQIRRFGPRSQVTLGEVVSLAVLLHRTYNGWAMPEGIVKPFVRFAWYAGGISTRR